MPKHMAASGVAVRFAILDTQAKLTGTTETLPYATAKVQHQDTSAILETGNAVTT